MIIPYNALLYLALIRPLFCIRAIVKSNGNSVKKHHPVIVAFQIFS